MEIVSAVLLGLISLAIGVGLLIYGFRGRRESQAQANVIGSAMFFLALAIVIAGQLVKRKKNR